MTGSVRLGERLCYMNAQISRDYPLTENMPKEIHGFMGFIGSGLKFAETRALQYSLPRVR